MHLTQMLVETGVQISQVVGLIVEGQNDKREWCALQARVAHICSAVPETLKDHEDVEDFDPEYDILLMWGPPTATNAVYHSDD